MGEIMTLSLCLESSTILYTVRSLNLPTHNIQPSLSSQPCPPNENEHMHRHIGEGNGNPFQYWIGD